MIDGDLRRASGGRDHRARVVPACGGALAHIDAVPAQEAGLGQAEVRSDDERASGLEEGLRRDDVGIVHELGRAEHEQDAHARLARLEALALDDHGLRPEVLEENAEAGGAPAGVVEGRSGADLGLRVRADEDGEPNR